MTPHNEAKKEDISKTVIMPGDPLRAKYIAEHFLENARLVNTVRGMFAYTGIYRNQQGKTKELTVMASGMGIPSMGIYSYELFKEYEVENIIRIGSCGAYSPELNLFDIILSESCYTESNYAFTLNNENCHLVSSNKELNDKITITAQETDVPLKTGNTVCTDCFDFYMSDWTIFLDRIPKEINPLSAEMEAFSLFYNAKLLHKKAACLMSVVDSKYKNSEATPQQREKGLNTMIQLALDSCISL